jgi:hypothetical protein
MYLHHLVSLRRICGYQNRTGILSDPEDAGIAHTMSLTRPRPAICDSPFWEIPSSLSIPFTRLLSTMGAMVRSILSKKNHLVDAHSFRHPYHPDQDWNEFCNRIVSCPAESCDCQRSSSLSTRPQARMGHRATLLYDPSTTTH